MDDYADNFTDTSAAFGQVAVGGSRTGNLEAMGDRDWFQVQLSAGWNYVINLQGQQSGGGTLDDPYLRVYNSSGSFLAENDDIVSGTIRDSQLTLQATATGIYYIEAGAFDDGAGGTYRVSVSSAGPTDPSDDYADSSVDTAAPMGQVAVNGSSTGNLEAAGDRDWFRLQVTAGTNYVIKLQGQSGGGGSLEDPYLRIHDNSGATIAENDDIVLHVDRDSQLAFTAGTTGILYIEAGAFNDDYAGTYRISVTGIGDDYGGQFLTGVSYADLDHNNFYSIGEGRSGMSVTVGGFTSTGAEGGYTLQVGSGVQNVTFSGGGLSAPISLAVNVLPVTNAKVDIVDQNVVYTSASLTDLGGAATIVGLGTIGLSLTGDGGNDTIFGTNGNDTLNGADGNDHLRGGGGVDQLFGGDGNDYLESDGGNGEWASGGIGFDTLGVVRAPADSAIAINFRDGQASGGFAFGGMEALYAVLSEASDSILGGVNRDVVLGQGGNDLLYGWSGHDYLSGGSGADAIYGGDGSDTLDGDAGNDSLLGDAGVDLVRGGDGTDLVLGGLGSDSLYGGTGTDYFIFVSSDLANGETDQILDFGDNANPSGYDFLYLPTAVRGSVLVAESSYGTALYVPVGSGGYEQIVVANMTAAQLADQILYF